MSSYCDPEDRFSRDVGSMREEMVYFRDIQLNHPNRGGIHAGLQRRLQDLLRILRDENNKLENKIRGRREYLESLLAGGGRMQAIHDNIVGPISAEIKVLVGQQESIASNIETVEEWCAELRGTR